MSGLIESATAILSASQKRLDIASNNVANISTPGYKRQIGFARLLAPSGNELSVAQDVAVERDFAAGKLTVTGNKLDIAIDGEGFFQLRAGDALIYSRQGQFSLAEDGTVVTPQGYVLQQAGGGDLVLDSGAVEIHADGTVLDNGAPVARLAVFSTNDPAALTAVGASHFAAPDGAMEIVAAATFRQGMVESSNVEIGGEMVTMMASLRQSEIGARLVQTYDALLGSAISTFGKG